MNYRCISLVLIVAIGQLEIRAMEEIVLKGDCILLPQPLCILSEEEQELFSLTEDDLYEDKLGVTVHVTSAQREAKKGTMYLLKTYSPYILTNKAEINLSADEKCIRICDALENWNTGQHPFISCAFPEKIPFNLITERKLQQLVDGETPDYIELKDEESQNSIRLYFAQDNYAWAGEIPCSEVAKSLLRQYQLVKKQKQIEEDEKFAQKLEMEVESPELPPYEDEEVDWEY